MHQLTEQFFSDECAQNSTKINNFSNNFMNYGKGVNIYLDNCKAIIEFTNFQGLNNDIKSEMRVISSNLI